MTTDTFADCSVIPHGFPVGTSFAIVSTNIGNPLLTNQMVNKIEKILENQGYVVNGMDADYRLLVDYKITERKFTANETEYSPKKTKNNNGFVKDDSGRVRYNESSTVSVEWKTVPEQRLQYIRELSIHVVDAKKEEIWNGSAKNIGDKADIPEALDYLLFSVLGRFGHATQKGIVSKVYENDLLKH